MLAVGFPGNNLGGKLRFFVLINSLLVGLSDELMFRKLICWTTLTPKFTLPGDASAWFVGLLCIYCRPIAASPGWQYIPSALLPIWVMARMGLSKTAKSILSV